MTHTIVRSTTDFLRTLPKFLILAAWFALVVAMGELLVLAVRKYGLDEMLFVGPQIVWMTPLSYLLFFLGVGLALGVVGWRWPRVATEWIRVFVLAFLSAFSFLFLYHPRLHKLAILALAGGLAVQTARVSVRHWEGFGRLIRRSAVVMVAVVVLLAAIVHGRPWLVERRELAALPPVSSASPNVLLIVMDTVRAESLSLYGYGRPTTPQLERLAKKGVRFDWAISTAPWTTPSHASMFTGRWPHDLSSDWRTMELKPLDTSYPTIAEELRNSGYLTAGFVANMEYCGYETGLNRGFTHYEDYPFSVGEVVVSSSLGRFIANSPKLRTLTEYHELASYKSAADVNESFLGWLGRQDQERPFFAFLNYFDAHEPYLPPKPFEARLGSVTPRNNSLIQHWRNHQAKRADKEDMSAQEIEAELYAYEGSIAYIDQQLGILFDALEKRDVLQNTLVILTSDHGEQFGEHGLFEHVNSLYLPLLHVPLVIIFPSRVPMGVQVSEPVSLQELPTTISDLLRSRENGFAGASLARFWDRVRAPAVEEQRPLLSEADFMPDLFDWWPISKGNMKSLLLDPYHYIKNGDGSEELYDFKRDYAEKENLAATEEGRRFLDQFRASLDSILVNDWALEAQNPARPRSDEQRKGRRQVDRGRGARGVMSLAHSRRNTQSAVVRIRQR